MKIHNVPRGERDMSAGNSNFDLGALFDGHIAREFADFDVDATMETMVAEPYVHCVATLAGASAAGKSVAFTASISSTKFPKMRR
jgi:hypothetical protein